MKSLITVLLCAAGLMAQSAGITNVTVSYSATPTFTTTAGITNFDLTLTGNVTSSTFSSAAVGNGTMNICQDGTGSRTLVWPVNFVGFPTISATPSACTRVTWKYDGTNVTAIIAPSTVTGGTCTNQAATAIGSTGIPTCTTLTSAYVNTSIAQTGTDINTSHQVTTTHLASALPVNQGGTGATSLPGSSGNVLYNNGGALGAKAVTVTKAMGCAVGDPAGSALATGVLCYFVAPSTCTIQSWDILVDSGTATAGIWKIATGTAIPTVSNSIIASAAPAIATATAIHSTTMTGWTTSVTAYDIFGLNLTTTSGPKFIYVGVNCDEIK